MAEERDLLPWITGALLCVLGVAAIAVAVHTRAAPASRFAVQPTIDAAPSAPLAASAITAPVAMAAAAATSTDPTPPQIWECRRDGQRIFSDTRCGIGAIARAVAPINVMPAERRAPPFFMPRMPTAPESDADGEADYDGASDGVGATTAARDVYVLEARRREHARHRGREHPHAPEHAAHGGPHAARPH